MRRRKRSVARPLRGDRHRKRWRTGYRPYGTLGQRAPIRWLGLDLTGEKNHANSQSFDGHLIAVTALANRSKGARGPETWRPPDANHWCDYAINWIVVKNTWDLTATNDEWNALTEMLETCPSKLVISRDTQ